MNCSVRNQRMPGPPTATLLGLGLLLVRLSLSAQAAAIIQTNPPASDRYLLIVETSPGMQRRAENVQRTVGRLFSTGLNGQLRPGDTIGVWTYDDAIHSTKFPLARWTPQAGPDITKALVQFLAQQENDKPSRLDPVLAQMTNVVARSERITVLLVSDGREAPVGTPFDAQIAEAYKLNAAEQERQSMPFVTIWRAVQGEFTAFKVNLPPWPVEFPAFPTNRPPVAKLTPVSSVKPTVKAAPVAQPIVITNVPPPTTNLPAAKQITPPPVVEPTNAVTAVAAPAVVTSNVSPARKALATSAPVTPPEPEAPPPITKKPFAIIPMLVGAGVALLGLTIGFLVMLKRSRAAPHVSLITRSMNQDEK